jgi:methylenetetrahydrofolate dehydrogenase (NADP+)/methenyltetrahydrofolate cyclohydrolase
MQIIDGRATANTIKSEIKAEVDSMRLAGQRAPHLAAVLVGHDGGSETYVAYKIKDCEEVGFRSTLVRFEDDVEQEKLLGKIKELNEDDQLDGFIVQLPLPGHIDEQRVTLWAGP